MTQYKKSYSLLYPHYIKYHLIQQSVFYIVNDKNDNEGYAIHYNLKNPSIMTISFLPIFYAKKKIVFQKLFKHLSLKYNSCLDTPLDRKFIKPITDIYRRLFSDVLSMELENGDIKYFKLFKKDFILIPYSRAKEGYAFYYEVETLAEPRITFIEISMKKYETLVIHKTLYNEIFQYYGKNTINTALDENFFHPIVEIYAKLLKGSSM